MELLTGSVKRSYFKYLSAAFGSAFISSIYGIVDASMVGQYHGPEGSAAMAVIAPIWNVLYGFGLLTGIGGSVLFATLRGEGKEEESNQMFSAAAIGTGILALLCWGALIFFEVPLLKLFGAQGAQLPLALKYVLPIRFTVPLFLFVQLLSAFLRNDSDPGLATRAVIIGGLFNVVGDYILIFPCDLGIMGAGIATCAGAGLSVLIMLTHFKGQRNTLRWSKPVGLGRKLMQILSTGFSTFFIDIAMGILTTLFNRQILAYLNADALSVYAVIINLSTIVQCSGYSIGQAAQPIISVNFGAGQRDRIAEALRYALATSVAFGLAWTALIWFLPNVFIRIFMQANDDILAIAPSICRSYGISFLLLPLNIFSTYYFQAVLQPKMAFLVSVLRGAVVSGALILLLPKVFGGSAVWFAMPVTELMIAACVLPAMLRRNTFDNSIRMH